MEDVFVMVVLIVLMGVGGGILREHLRGKREAQYHSGVDAEGLHHEIAALQDRVAVLEQIVTDGKYELRRELDQL